MDKEEAAAGVEPIRLLLGTDRRAMVKQQKEWKEQAREFRTKLSPRSQKLREAAEAAELAKQEDRQRQWQEDEESGRRWTAGKWLQSHSVAQVVAEALELPARSEKAGSQFLYVKKLTRERIQELLDKAGMGGLADFVVGCVASLATQSTGSAERLNEKFGTSAKFQMTYGSLSLFYGGLESLLGPPKMYKGPQHEEKTLFNSMEFEHCGEKDASEMFTAPNGVTTTSETEWVVVCRPDADADYPERTGYRAHHPEWCRNVRPLSEMVQAMEDECNAKLRSSGHSEVRRH